MLAYEQNLSFPRDLSPEERHERASKAGKASVAARRKKKNMREMATAMLNAEVKGELKSILEQLGVEEDDMTYAAAVVARLLNNAVQKGDPASIRMLAELTGQTVNGLNEIDADVVDMQWPAVNLPDNGRDKIVDKMVLRPQSGPQTQFMCTNADIAIYGGAAGGGKTYGLLMEGLRHRKVKGFGAVIFRKNSTQITAEGGLWDASQRLYNMVEGANAKKTPSLHWDFQGGGKLTFAHIERDDDLKKWQGTEICFLGFDELTHFTQHQFTYMLSRNRSTCGIRPYVRATCNPDADSWVADFISWWIDQETGYPIKERSGQIRWMLMVNDTFKWADTPEELAEQYDRPITDCKSVTFISSKLTDNKVLMENDPGYVANLRAMTEVDRERLLEGNWKIKASAGRYFKRTQVQIINAVPTDIVAWCRGWDLAATSEDENGNADFTAGVLMGKREDGSIVVLDVINERIGAGDVERLVYNTSQLDKQKYGYLYTVRMAQDPGQAGKVLALQYIKLLSGFDIKVRQITGSKETRATPLAAQWQNGNIQVLLADWTDEYLSQMESFPESMHDDMVDASSDAFSELAEGMFSVDNLL